MAAARTSAIGVEPLVAVAVAALAGLAVIATSDIEIKYRIAVATALAGSALLIALPERRIACVVLWLLIHPLGIEKVVYIDAAESAAFINPTLVFNMSDGPLALLALFTAVETVFTGRIALSWSRMTTIMLMLLVWSVISFGVHSIYLLDGFITSAPLALLQDVRLLLFVLLLQSAIRSRGDVVLVLLTMGLAVLLQSIVVGLSYVTDQDYTSMLASLSAAGLQTFDTAGAGSLSRASGTVGQVNQQAAYHVFMTLPLIGLFVVRNRWIRWAGLVIVAGSALAIVLTFSRGAWLSFPIGLMVCGMLALWRGMLGRKSVLVGAGGLVVGAVALLFLSGPIYERLAFGDSGATQSRLRMLDLATDLFQESPIIGVGPGEYSEAALHLYPPDYDVTETVAPGEHLPYPSGTVGRVDIAQIFMFGIQVRRPLPVHNKYMLMLSELGVPGLILWVWLFAEFIRMGWRCSKSKDPVFSLLGIAGIATAVAQAVYMNVDLFTEDKELEFMLFVAAFMVAAARCADAVPDRRTAVVAPWSQVSLRRG